MTLADLESSPSITATFSSLQVILLLCLLLYTILLYLIVLGKMAEKAKRYINIEMGVFYKNEISKRRLELYN